MTYKRQFVMLSCIMLITLDQYVHAALVGTSALTSGSMANTLAFVTGEVADAVSRGVQSGQSVDALSVQQELTNQSALDFVNANMDLFEDSAPSTSPSESGSDDPKKDEKKELLESAQKVFDAWINYPTIMESLNKVITNQTLNKDLTSYVNSLRTVVPKGPATIPNLTLQEVTSALLYSLTRQQAYWVSKFEPIKSSDVEILAPIGKISQTSGFLFPPVTYDVEFTPKQKLSILINNFVNPLGSASFTKQLPDEMTETLLTIDGIQAAGERIQMERMYNNILPNALKKIKDNFGKIQEAIAQFLVEQGKAEAIAQNTDGAWESFKNSYAKVSNQGLFTKFKQWAFGTPKININNDFKHDQLQILKQYFEGEIEAFASDLMIYSSIVKMGENELSTKFAKRFTDDGWKMVQYMILGGALVSVATSNDDDKSMKNRMKALYIATTRGISDTVEMNVEAFRTFAQLGWYAVTGAMTKINQNKNKQRYNQFKISQSVLAQFIKEFNKQQILEEVKESRDIVKAAKEQISLKQAYGLNFNKNILAQLGGILDEETIGYLKQDKVALYALEAELFEFAATASLLVKSQYYSDKILTAMHSLFLSANNMLVSAQLGRGVESKKAEQALKQATEKVSDALDTAQKQEAKQASPSVKQPISNLEALEAMRDLQAQEQKVIIANTVAEKVAAVSQTELQQSDVSTQTQEKVQEVIQKTVVEPLINNSFDSYMQAVDDLQDEYPNELDSLFADSVKLIEKNTLNARLQTLPDSVHRWLKSRSDKAILPTTVVMINSDFEIFPEKILENDLNLFYVAGYLEALRQMYSN